MAHWPTPDAALGDGGKVSRGGARKDEALLAGMAKWPTPNANDALNAGYQMRNGTAYPTLPGATGAAPVPNDRRKSGSAGWSTPRSGNGAAGALRDPDHILASPRGHSSRIEDQVAVESRAWPTPTQRDHKDGGSEACANVPENGLLGRAVHEGEKVGSLALHPDWVEALIGWPLCWTSLEPLTALIWPALHGAQVAGPGQPQHPWEPPRVASGVKDRAKRLRGIGNGQHPFAAALAWRVLSAALAAEGEES